MKHFCIRTFSPRVATTVSWSLILTCLVASTSIAKDPFQYQSGEIAIPAASADEPQVQTFGVDSIRGSK